MTQQSTFDGLAQVKDGVGAEIDRYLRRVAPYGFSGTVLLARDGEVVLHQGYGLADRERRLPVTVATVFDIGSLTKQFTAAAIMKLAEQGRLRVDDRIGRHLPGVPPDKAEITIHQLLTHTAGMVNFVTSEEYDPSYDYQVKPRDAFLEEGLATELQWPPGTRYDYSNIGYGLLGAIVEFASGQPYDQYLHAHLFLPAGMAKTGTVLPRWEENELAQGYQNGRRWGTALDFGMAPEGPWWNLRAAGGILATVADLYRWHLALSNDSVLSSASRDRLFAPHVATNASGNSFYGYGWGIDQTPRGTADIWHNGSNSIFYAEFHRYVSDDAVLILATNALNDYLAPIKQNISNMLFGTRAPVLPPPVAEPGEPVTLARYAGPYALPSGDTFVIRVEGDRLNVTPVGQEAVETLIGPSIDEATTYRQQQRQAKAIVAGLNRGDFEPLAAVTEAERFQRLKAFLIDFWEPRWAQENGDSPQVLGTMPTWWRADGRAASIVARGREDPPLQILWNGGEVGGLAIGAVNEPARTAFLPQSATEFVGFHPGIEKAVALRFHQAADGSVTALTLTTGDGRPEAGPVSAREERLAIRHGL